MSWRRLLFLLLMAWVWSSPSRVLAAAREITITAKTDATITALVQVVVPGATCAAVHDASSILVVGHNTMNNQHLSVYRLDASGNLSATPPVRIALPRPDTSKTIPHLPTSMAFHPKLPILYVWQGEELVSKDFCHLLIYSVNNGTLQLAQSHGRGADFNGNVNLGSIGLDSDGKRIFLPNLVSRPPAAATLASVGYYCLDALGMPIKAAGQDTPILESACAQVGFPCGMGFVAVGNEAVLLGINSGLSTWDLNNRRARFSHFYYSGVGGNHMITGHPKLPFVYGAGVGINACYRMEHVDGYMTLLPQVVTVNGANFQSAPLFMARQNKLAIGGVNNIFLLALDSEGRFAGTAEQNPVASPALRAIAYSEKYDRLYMAVEEAK